MGNKASQRQYSKRAVLFLVPNLSPCNSLLILFDENPGDTINLIKAV